MNTNTTVRFAALRSLALLALCALPTLCKADVTIDKINTPSQQCGLPASDTALQFHVINSGNTAANNNKITITLQTWAEGPTSKQFTFSSSSFNLVAYQQEWITVMIPATEYGITLKGHELKGAASLNGKHSYYLDFNDNGAYNPWPAVPPAKLQITKVATPSTQKNNAPFYITVTNTGGQASVAETLKVVQQPRADGPDGPSHTSSVTVPILQPGEAMVFTFDAVDYDSDEVEGAIYLNNVFQEDFSFWG
jgi:hypothetical protein